MDNASGQQQIITEMEHDWPKWQIWVVNRVAGGPVWAARRWDGTGQVINTDSPEELTEALQEAAGC
jgi:hypothetical protein